MNELLKLMGQRIRDRRLFLKMSQTELANRSGYSSRSSINKVEKGLVDIPQSKIKLIADVLMTTPASLMGWDEQVEQSCLPSGVRPIADQTSNQATILSLNNPFEELWNKISSLDEIDRGKVDAFVSGLLAADKYSEPTRKLKIAARGGGVKEVTVTDSQVQEILNMREVTSLGSDKP